MKQILIKITLLLYLIIGLCSLSGCNLVKNYWVQRIYQVPAGSILFMEDFSSDQNGWRTWNEEEAIVNYQSDGFRFLINEPNFDYVSTPGYRFQDTKTSVDAIKIGGPNDNAFGVICRYVDPDNYYAFLISSDGYAGVLRVLEGEYTLLNANTLEYSDRIHQGEALNEITAECIGSTLVLSVNEEVIFQVSDESLLTGDVGLMASTYEEPGVDILFDNLTVVQP